LRITTGFLFIRVLAGAREKLGRTHCFAYSEYIERVERRHSAKFSLRASFLRERKFMRNPIWFLFLKQQENESDSG